MSKHWVRQEVKKEAIADTLSKSVSWFEANRQQAIAAGGAILVLLILGGYFAFQKLSGERMAWRLLAYSQSLAYQGKLPDALNQLEMLSDRYSNSSAWGFGVLLAGDINFRSGQYTKAVDFYRKIVDRQAPKALVPIALSDEILAEESGNDCRDSIETSKRFLEQYKDHYLAPQANASLARCLKAMGRNEEAKAALQQMSTLYPADQEPYWNQWAQAQLKASS